MVGAFAGLGLWLPPVLAAQTFTNFHNFNFDIGGVPGAGLTLWQGIIYGTTGHGGINNGSGTVFALDFSGTNYTVLHTFAEDEGNPFLGYINSDGVGPWSSLVVSGNTLYGTAIRGGPTGNGTIFTVRTDGTGFTNLYFFTGTNDGSLPSGELILSGNVFYGTTQAGGQSNQGTIFAINCDGTGFTNVHVFTGQNEGMGPSGLLLSGSTLYGTAQFGGSNNSGNVFAINTDGTGFTVLYAFSATIFGENRTNAEGAEPVGALVLSGSELFGTASSGGTNGLGTLFAVDTNGTGFTTLHAFNGSDGYRPFSGMVQFGDTLYGTTDAGGSSATTNPTGTVFSSGTIFSVGMDGTGFRTLYNFSAISSSGTNNDGSQPENLVICSNTIYGTAQWGGIYNDGTIFSLTLPLPPDLNIALAGTNAILTWPTNAIIYTLQSATSLAPPVAWNPVSPSPAIVNGQNTVTNPLSATQMFYRLSQ